MIEEYFSDVENIVRFEGNQKKSIESVISFIQKLKNYDRPDAYSIIDDTALIIEHFEFDSTYSNKKGSENRQELARVERNFEEKISKCKMNNGETMMIHDEMFVTHTTENYINNAMRVFDNHYKKIDEYKTNLFKKGEVKDIKTIKTMFWIEDTTIFGNIFMTKDKGYNESVKPLILLYCDEFLNKLSNCNNLNYIFFFSHYGNEKNIWFLDLDFIDAYKGKQIITSEIEIIDFSSHTTGFVTVLSENEVKKCNLK
ncbi:hypothetical protein [Thomasclavelia spiroformis]|uniref:hypothetical protein n=1 Tax=Thomasclavelia spiroformis TaxID=29348 RepID=UPI00241BE653|nr:hypothetical protein [Thomasclavelia spiroformis]MBS6686173.1 hypothetical protein [Thomasclavelia spiroformis]